MARVLITGPAARDIEFAYEWWSEHRSPHQAARWYNGIYEAIESLRRDAERWPVAPETDLSTRGIRQLLYGLGNKPTHRIIFIIEDEAVIVLRVRHTAQRTLTADDLTEP